VATADVKQNFERQGVESRRRALRAVHREHEAWPRMTEGNRATAARVLARFSASRSASARKRSASAQTDSACPVPLERKVLTCEVW
jgi:hypothetical protein